MCNIASKLKNIKSKYRGVSYHFNNSNKTHSWRFTFETMGMKAVKMFPYTDNGERQAAILYDKKLIEYDRKPINILIHKC